MIDYNENDIKFDFAKENDLMQIENLSKSFEEENCCNGIVADNKEYLASKKIAIAKINNQIIGYCYGEFEIKNRDTSLYKKGQKSFYIEEIYILKKFRNKSLGEMLYKFIEQFAKENGCEFIETTAVSKDYKRLLSFYIDKLNMKFWSASLIKKIN